MTGPKLSGCLALFLFLVEYTAANCALKLDLAFIIDGTNAVSARDFSKLKQAVLALLRCMHERDQVHAGVIVYGSSLARPIPLSGDRHKLVELEGVDPPMGQPQTHIALLNGRALFRKRGRARVKKVLVLLTSGLGNFVRETVHQAILAREEGYRIFVVTLAANVEGADQLPWRPGDIFKLGSATEMVEELGKIARMICSVAYAAPSYPLVPPAPIMPLTKPEAAPGHVDLTGVLRKKITRVSSGLCGDRQMVEDVGYSRHPEDCDKFVQCYPTDSGAWDPVVRSCAVGEFWDHALLTCRIAEVVDCPLDKCNDSSVTSVPHPNNCMAYYRCEEGRSVGQCCSRGSGYVPGQGCVDHAKCLDQCPPEVIPRPGFCDRAPVFGRPEVYSQYISAGSYWIEMICPNGSLYNDRKCGCAESGWKPWETEADTTYCKPQVYLPFCDGLTDHSGQNSVIKNEGDQVLVIDGKAYFDGHSALYLPGFSNIRYGNILAIKLKYKLADIHSDGSDDYSEEYGDFDYSYDDTYDGYDDDDDDNYNTMTLVSNGDCDGDLSWAESCYENPTITIGTNRQKTIFDVLTSNTTHMELHKKADDKTDEAFDVDYIDDEYYSYLFENEFHDETNNCSNDTWDEEWRTLVFLVHNNTFRVYDNGLQDHRTISGFVQTTAAGLQFGQGSGFRNFKGYMDEIYVYLCRPDDSTLFGDHESSVLNNNDRSITLEPSGSGRTGQVVPDATLPYSTTTSESSNTAETENVFPELTTSNDLSLHHTNLPTETVSLDYDYLTGVVSEALNSEFYETTESPEMSDLREGATLLNESSTTSNNIPTTLSHRKTTFSDSQTELMEATSRIATDTMATPTKSAVSLTEISSNTFIDKTASSTSVADAETSLAERSTKESSSSVKTTFEPEVNTQTTGSEQLSTVDELISDNDVTSISNNVIPHNTTLPSYGGNLTILDSNLVFNNSIDHTLLNNHSLNSSNKSEDVYISQVLEESLKLDNQTLTLQNFTERKGSLHSHIEGAIGRRIHTAQSIRKTNGAIKHNENGRTDDKRGHEYKTSMAEVPITVEPSSGDTHAPPTSVTESPKLAKRLFIFGRGRARSRGHDSEHNATKWQTED